MPASYTGAKSAEIRINTVHVRAILAAIDAAGSVRATSKSAWSRPHVKGLTFSSTGWLGRDGARSITEPVPFARTCRGPASTISGQRRNAMAAFDRRRE
jgi:hypothetical protein